MLVDPWRQNLATDRASSTRNGLVAGAWFWLWRRARTVVPCGVGVADEQRRRGHARTKTRMLLHGEVTDRIIGAFYEAYDELGYGFTERVYGAAFAIALDHRG